MVEAFRFGFLFVFRSGGTVRLALLEFRLMRDVDHLLRLRPQPLILVLKF